jgi:hypothetical protein
MTQPLIAYHNQQSAKDAILAQLNLHRDADQIIKGKYWQDGKGCAVGCTIHSGNHIEYEPRFGIPVMLARFEDRIFEGLPNGKAKDWPIRFMSAIKPGQDLSLVGWKFLHWLLTDEKINPGIMHPLVKDAVAQCAEVVCNLAKGNPFDASAARSAESAAWSASWSAERSGKRSAARSAESAACAARCAARSAESAESAAWSAAGAAWSVKSAARCAARSAAYEGMADALIELIEAAPMAEAH